MQFHPLGGLGGRHRRSPGFESFSWAGQGQTAPESRGCVLFSPTTGEKERVTPVHDFLWDRVAPAEESWEGGSMEHPCMDGGDGSSTPVPLPGALLVLLGTVCCAPGIPFPHSGKRFTGKNRSLAPLHVLGSAASSSMSWWSPPSPRPQLPQ